MGKVAVAIETSMGEKGKHMPPFPRLELGGYTILPQVNDEWEPIFGMWVLPGRRVLTSEQVCALAAGRGLSVSILTQ